MARTAMQTPCVVNIPPPRCCLSLCYVYTFSVISLSSILLTICMHRSHTWGLYWLIAGPFVVLFPIFSSVPCLVRLTSSCCTTTTTTPSGVKCQNFLWKIIAAKHIRNYSDFFSFLNFLIIFLKKTGLVCYWIILIFVFSGNFEIEFKSKISIISFQIRCRLAGCPEERRRRK